RIEASAMTPRSPNAPLDGSQPPDAPQHAQPLTYHTSRPPLWKSRRVWWAVAAAGFLLAAVGIPRAQRFITPVSGQSPLFNHFEIPDFLAGTAMRLQLNGRAEGEHEKSRWRYSFSYTVEAEEPLKPGD